MLCEEKNKNNKKISYLRTLPTISATEITMPPAPDPPLFPRTTPTDLEGQ